MNQFIQKVIIVSLIVIIFYEMWVLMNLKYVTIAVCYSPPYEEEEVEEIIQKGISDINRYCLFNLIPYRFKYHLEKVPIIGDISLNITKHLNIQGIHYIVGFDYSNK